METMKAVVRNDTIGEVVVTACSDRSIRDVIDGIASLADDARIYPVDGGPSLEVVDVRDMTGDDLITLLVQIRREYSIDINVMVSAFDYCSELRSDLAEIDVYNDRVEIIEDYSDCRFNTGCYSVGFADEIGYLEHIMCNTYKRDCTEVNRDLIDLYIRIKQDDGVTSELLNRIGISDREALDYLSVV